MKKLSQFAEIALIVLLLPLTLTGMKTARMVDYDQTAPLVTTAAGVTNATVTLTKTLFDDDVASVSEVTSSNTADTPATVSYTSGSKALLINGLNANDTRTLYVTYGYQRFDDMMDTFWAYGPTFLMIGLIIHVLLSVFKVRAGF